MLKQLYNWKFYIMIIGDVIFLSFALILAYLIRFDFILKSQHVHQIFQLLPVIILANIAAMFTFGLYKGMWRYSSLGDAMRLFQAVVVASLIIIAAFLYINRFESLSRSIFVLDAIFNFLILGAYRITIRYYYSIERGANIFAITNIFGKQKSNKSKTRVLIIGAGDASEKILREIRDNHCISYKVIGLIDDDPHKIGRTIHGVPILGDLDSIADIVEQKDVQELFIAIPSATGKEIRRIVKACEKCKIAYKTLPGIGDIMDGKVSIKNLRDVKYTDLLRRPQVHLDLNMIEGLLSDKVVLITGCGGSIGSELCRQVIKFKPKSMLLLDASETNLYGIEMELRYGIGFTNYKTVLGSIQDEALMNKVFGHYKPQVIFHAAAYKHVPMLEINPWEAVYNNVIGSKVIMEISAAYGVERFVLVSTDKAVRPTNVMGASKRIAELLSQSFQGLSKTKFIEVRFGNVLGSSGSVIPLFRRQIELGGPVTVTDPNVMRYFMSISEAVQLILQAGGMGDGGELFILKMGTPVKIADMARDLIRLSGKEPDKDIEIVFTELRPGEKLKEELITQGEGIVPTSHEKIMVIKADGKFNGNSGQDAFGKWLKHEIKELEIIAATRDGSLIRNKLKEIVPEYQPREQDRYCDVLSIPRR